MLIPHEIQMDVIENIDKLDCSHESLSDVEDEELK